MSYHGLGKGGGGGHHGGGGGGHHGGHHGGHGYGRRGWGGGWSGGYWPGEYMVGYYPVAPTEPLYRIQCDESATGTSIRGLESALYRAREMARDGRRACRVYEPDGIRLIASVRWENGRATVQMASG